MASRSCRLIRLGLVLSLAPLAAFPALAQAPAAKPGTPAAPAAGAKPAVALPPDTFTANAMGREGFEAFDRNEWKTVIEKLTPYCAYQEKVGIVDGYDNVLFCLGYSLFAEKQYGNAIEYLQKYIAKYPTGTFINESGLAVAKCYYGSKDWDNAIKQFVKLRNVPALKEEVLPMLAEVYTQAEQPSEAVKMLEEYLLGGFNSTERINAALTLASMYLDGDKTDKGIEILEKIKSSPSSADFVIILNNKALATAAQLLDNNPGAALRAFQAVRWKSEVVKVQTARLEVLNAKIADWKRLRSLTKGAAATKYENWITEGTSRHAQLKGMVDEVQKEENYDATLVYSIARCYASLKRNWESELGFRTVVEKFPTFSNAGDAKLGQILALTALKRKEDSLKVAWEFLDKFPKHHEIPTVSEMIVGMSIEANDFDAAKKAVNGILTNLPDAPNRAKLMLMDTVADFENMDFKGARITLDKLRKEFPNDENKEEIDYRYALSYFFDNDQPNTLTYLTEFLDKHPNSQLIPDAIYRLNLIRYGVEMAKKNAAQKKREPYVSFFRNVIDDVKRTIERYPEAINLGELYALLGDCFDQMTFEEAEALKYNTDTESPSIFSGNAYRDAVLKSGPENTDVREYSLEQAKNKFQADGRFDEIQKMFRQLMDKYPSSTDRLKWLNEETRAIARQGKSVEERLANKAKVKQVLATEIMANINKPNKEGVEMLIEQLVGACIPKNKPRAAVPVTMGADGKPAPNQPAPTPAPPVDLLPEANAELDSLLAGKLTPTGQARVAYAKYLMMAQVLKPDPNNPRKKLTRDVERAEAMDKIATDFKAEDFSSALLAVVGDHLKDKGLDEKAVTFYNRLIQFFPKSDYLDFGYVGMADILMKEKNFAAAQEKYKVAIDKLPGIKFPNASIGYARTLIEQKNYGDEPVKKLEEIVAVKEWKGPLHAEALFLIGECHRLNGNFPVAIKTYARIFLSYAKYEDWAIKGYLGAEFCHRASGETNQANNALKEAREYLVKRKLEQSPLMESVKNRAKENGISLN